MNNIKKFTKFTKIKSMLIALVMLSGLTVSAKDVSPKNYSVSKFNFNYYYKQGKCVKSTDEQKYYMLLGFNNDEIAINGNVIVWDSGDTYINGVSSTYNFELFSSEVMCNEWAKIVAKDEKPKSTK